MATGRLGLVLSGGGARAAYQVGMLRYIAERRPGESFSVLTGVSAGAINAAFLAAHRGGLTEAVRDLTRVWTELTVDRVMHLSLFPLVAAAPQWLARLLSRGHAESLPFRSVADTQPLRDVLSRVIDFSGIDSNVEAGRLRALALSSLNYATGETVTFVHGTRDVCGWERVMRRGVMDRITLDHVMASSAIPLVFPAVRVGAHYYGDGAIRQSAPLGPAIHLGAERILAIAVRHPVPAAVRESEVVSYPSPADVMAQLFHSVFLDSLDSDAERVRLIDRMLEVLPQETKASLGLKPIRLLMLHPSEDVGKMAVAYRKLLPRRLRLLMRLLGAYRANDAGLLSYLIFEEPYVRRLMDLGYEDARRRWGEIDEFLDAA